MAARFLTLHDRPMKYMKLLKLMYIAERRHLLRWGRSITYDRFKSMRRGPVLSETFDLIKSEPAPEIESVFRARIAASEDFTVALVGEAKPDEDSPLSKAQDQLIDEVYREFGNVDRWKLVEHTHTFPEWEDPGSSSKRIRLRTILERNGTPEPDVDMILAEISEVAAAEQVFAE